MAIEILFYNRETGETTDSLPPEELEQLRQAMWQSLLGA